MWDLTKIDQALLVLPIVVRHPIPGNDPSIPTKGKLLCLPSLICSNYFLDFFTKAEYDKWGPHIPKYAYKPRTKIAQSLQSQSCWHQYYPDPHLSYGNEEGSATVLESLGSGAFFHLKRGEKRYYTIFTQLVWDVTQCHFNVGNPSAYTEANGQILVYFFPSLISTGSGTNLS